MKPWSILRPKKQLFNDIEAIKPHGDLSRSSYLILHLNEDVRSTDPAPSFRVNIQYAKKYHQQVAHDEYYLIG